MAQIHGMDGRGGAGRAQTEDAEQDWRSTDGKCKENITHGGGIGEPRRRAPHCRRRAPHCRHPTHFFPFPLDGAVSRAAAVAIQARFWLVLRAAARQPVAYSRSTASSMLRPTLALAVHSQGQRVQHRCAANPGRTSGHEPQACLAGCRPAVRQCRRRLRCVNADDARRSAQETIQPPSSSSPTTPS